MTVGISGIHAIGTKGNGEAGITNVSPGSLALLQEARALPAPFLPVSLLVRFNIR
jgi:hypothetical protein